ncbi:MAG: hypothetical protein K0B02_05385 [DPANN group archaeon]|nr:hypothetical protein [DPANN group archaeon]
MLSIIIISLVVLGISLGFLESLKRKARHTVNRGKDILNQVSDKYGYQIDSIVDKVRNIPDMIKTEANLSWQKEKWDERKEFKDAKTYMVNLLNEYLPDMNTNLTAKQLLDIDKLKIKKVDVTEGVVGGHYLTDKGLNKLEQDEKRVLKEFKKDSKDVSSLSEFITDMSKIFEDSKTQRQQYNNREFDPRNAKHVVELGSGVGIGTKVHELTHLIRSKQKGESISNINLMFKRSELNTNDENLSPIDKSFKDSCYHDLGLLGTGSVIDHVKSVGYDYVRDLVFLNKEKNKGSLSDDQSKEYITAYRETALDRLSNHLMGVEEGAAKYIESKIDSTVDKNINDFVSDVSKDGYSTFDTILLKMYHDDRKFKNGVGLKPSDEPEARLKLASLIYPAGFHFFKGLEKKYGEKAATYAAFTATGNKLDAEEIAENYSKGVSIKDNYKFIASKLDKK